MTTAKILVGDATGMLRTLPGESVNCCVTSPPYWGLRDYGVDGQIGLEETFDEFLARLVDVFREVRRVLRPDGVAWVNMGDSYNANTGVGFNGNARRPSEARNTKVVSHLPAKNLLGQPWRLAFALQADGWWLRSDCIWHKPNPMPESITDRPTKAHEYVFLLTKSARYFYDAEAVRQPSCGRDSGNTRPVHGAEEDPKTMRTRASLHLTTDSGAANLRTVWLIASQPYSGAHFATFPEALAERCILSGCPAGGTVLDPFTGSGTTGAVAVRLGRNFVGTELNPEYAQMARQRITAVQPLFTQAEIEEPTS